LGNAFHCHSIEKKQREGEGLGKFVFFSLFGKREKTSQININGKFSSWDPISSPSPASQ
jgi:hypothetical protein